ncbi:permease prefix domain 1-containing protein [Erysipelothrix urinaevulpis]|uniref:permease prefix domain 1-containing protein n=1 Tax=Erysipelothrix urinaevulpis TaxID=2683717 RepID=UPI00135862D9|nr:permease prefix domain 1-containing protein [Erysipelothrix urinaevulpis]
MGISPKQQYIDNILKNVKNYFYHERIKNELLDHIESKIDNLTDQGLSIEEAETKTILEMGSAEETAMEFNQIYKFHHDLMVIVSRLMFMVGVVVFITQILWPLGRIYKERIDDLKIMNNFTQQIIELKHLESNKVNIKINLGDDVIKIDRILWSHDSDDLILRKSPNFSLQRVSFKTQSYYYPYNYCSEEGCNSGVEIEVPNQYYQGFEEETIIYLHGEYFLTIKDGKKLDDLKFTLYSGDSISELKQQVQIDDIPNLIGVKP